MMQDPDFPAGNGMDLYAVVGHPIAHSLSPRIHRAFAGQTRQNLSYEARLGAREGGFAAQVREWFHAGLKGLNVTVPFKEEAFHLADRCTPRAQQAAAVNTLWQDPDGALVGDNTDGIGFLRDLTGHLDFSPTGGRILLLGAGGAVRGLLGPLMATHPAAIVIANRRVERAEALVAAFAAPPSPPTRVLLTACSLTDIPPGPFDLVIHATAAALEHTELALPASLMQGTRLAYDLVYGPKARPFLDWAEQHGAARVSDGLGMLVEQAAEAFYLWRGVHPHTRPVLDQLRAELRASTGPCV